MPWNFFKMAPKSFLGVDIGTSYIKIIELSRWGKRIKLENYGEISALAAYEKPFRTFEKSTLTLSSVNIVRAISAILEEAKIKTTKACFSIPDFSTFFTSFSLPSMTKEEFSEAVKYEARKHIPLPLSEVTLDWQKINEGKILLVAVPNEIIEQYQEIAQNSRLELLSLEAEVFGLARALVGEKEEEKTTLGLIDIGARSTTVSIIEGETLKISHSFDTAGNDLTSNIAKGLNVSYEKAEELKKSHGLLPAEVNTRNLLLPLIDLILTEVKKVFQNFFQTENKKVQKFILAGGSALLPGLSDYFSENLQMSVEIADPFANLYYPPILEKTLKEMGPSYAIAVGTALRGLK